jgi:hypothetical protein
MVLPPKKGKTKQEAREEKAAKANELALQRKQTGTSGKSRKNFLKRKPFVPRPRNVEAPAQSVDKEDTEFFEYFQTALKGFKLGEPEPEPEPEPELQEDPTAHMSEAELLEYLLGLLMT